MASAQPGQQDGIQPDHLDDPYSRKPSNQKTWPKRYRTEIGASASSLLSTLVAVRLTPQQYFEAQLTCYSSRWILSRLACKPTDMMASWIAFNIPTKLRATRDSFVVSWLRWPVLHSSAQSHSRFTITRNTSTPSGCNATWEKIRSDTPRPQEPCRMSHPWHALQQLEQPLDRLSLSLLVRAYFPGLG